MDKKFSDKSISLTFTISNSSHSHSNIVCETYLDEDSIILDKKQLISRKKISQVRIPFNNISKVSLSKANANSLNSYILIEYFFDSDNIDSSYKVIYLKSSDPFGVKWFYDNLISFIEDFNNNEKKDKFNDFIKTVNTDSSRDDNKSKTKEKFYNYCVNGEY